jgi:UDP-N-acetylmuramoyl-tripeptide--D-alanyl-D-alanine ligase
MTDALWTPEALAAAAGGRWTGTPVPASGLSIDTRTLRPGDLFVALAGENRDGHQFVPAAFAAGAAAALVHASRAGEFAGAGPLLAVGDDVLAALERLGRAARARVDATVVAVTGSVGKTSTKEALRHVFARAGATHASVASYNNHWGVPLTLARMPASTRYGVFEIGMNHPFEIIPLAGMARPDIAIITTVEPVHLEHFRSVAAIADAKGEIFSGLRPGGTAIVNRDNPHVARLAAHAAASPAGRIVTFGEHAEADVRLTRVSLSPAMSAVEARVFGEPIVYKLGLPGKHMALNSLAVLAAARVAGLDLALAGLALADLAAGAGRGAQVSLAMPGGSMTLLDESYNANPASMRAALALLAQASVGFRGRRIAVLGDMLELGPSGPDMHRDLKGPVIENDVELVFCCGPLMRHLWQALPPDRRGGYADTSAGLPDLLLPRLQPGDAVMVKGSLGSRMGPVVAALKARYPAAPPAGTGA